MYASAGVVTPMAGSHSGEVSVKLAGGLTTSGAVLPERHPDPGAGVKVASTLPVGGVSRAELTEIEHTAMPFVTGAEHNVAPVTVFTVTVPVGSPDGLPERQQT